MIHLGRQRRTKQVRDLVSKVLLGSFGLKLSACQFAIFLAYILVLRSSISFTWINLLHKMPLYSLTRALHWRKSKLRQLQIFHWVFSYFYFRSYSLESDH